MQKKCNKHSNKLKEKDQKFHQLTPLFSPLESHQKLPKQHVQLIKIKSSDFKPKHRHQNAHKSSAQQFINIEKLFALFIFSSFLIIKPLICVNFITKKFLKEKRKLDNETRSSFPWSSETVNAINVFLLTLKCFNDVWRQLNFFL